MTVAGLPAVDLLGVRMTNATQGEAVALMDRWIHADGDRAHLVFIANAHTLNLSAVDAGYRAVLNDADVLFGDGTGVRMAARWRGTEMRDNLVGTDLLPRFFSETRGCRHRYFLLGGTPGTAERAGERIVHDFADVEIVGTHHGYVDGDGAAVVDMINRAAPDVLLVAMGNPIQETWLHRHRAALEVPVSVGVGGLFDHWAGNLRRAPRWVRRLGIEWVQILVQQPAKWRRYLLGNPRFAYRALRDARLARATMEASDG